jgi:hypothetical protein
MATEAKTTKEGNDSKFASHETQPKVHKKLVKHQGSESESDYSSDEVERPRRRPRKESSGGALLIAGVGDQMSKTLEDVSKTANGLVNSASTTLGNVSSTALQTDAGKQQKSDTLRLRLDLNLDVEITLKAKIHGDLELALL